MSYLAISHYLFVTALFVVSATTSDQVGPNDLALLCANKKVALTSVSQLKQLVEQLESVASAECQEKIRDPLVELVKVVDEHAEDDICSQEKADQIKDYYQKYVANQQQAKYTKYLARFFIGYGLQVSGICRSRMISLLTTDSKKYLESGDFDEINKWTDDKSMIAMLMKGSDDYEDLVLAKNLIKPSSSSSDDKVFLQTATSNLIKRIQAICERRFRPFYAKLILPLVTLLSVGFNHKNYDKSQSQYENSGAREYVHQWYRIVFMCEILAGVEFVEDPEDRKRSEGMNKRLVRILNRTEVAKLKEWQVTTTTSLAHDERELWTQFEQVNYVPSGGPNGVGDQIIDGNDKQLIKAIRGFRAPKGDYSIKLMRKMFSLIRDKLKRRVLRRLGAGGGGGESSKGHLSSGELIKLIDEYMQRLDSIDTPVSGSSADYGPSHASFEGRRFKLRINRSNSKQAELKWYKKNLKLKAIVAVLVIVVILVVIFAATG